MGFWYVANEKRRIKKEVNDYYKKAGYEEPRIWSPAAFVLGVGAIFFGIIFIGALIAWILP